MLLSHDPYNREANHTSHVNATQEKMENCTTLCVLGDIEPYHISAWHSFKVSLSNQWMWHKS